MRAYLTTQSCILSVFTALVCLATISFTVYVPSTRGYFNIGETMVYTAAILFGPFIGAFAGGVGSMLADVLLGYYYYAPATLVIKAVEGFVVGFLSRRGYALLEVYTRRELRIFTAMMGILIGALVGFLGIFYYSGFAELNSRVFPLGNSVFFFIPMEFWLGIGVFFVFTVCILAFKFEPEYGFTIVSCVFGGLLMVLGYFLYEQFLLGVFALAEVPINVGQMTIGLIVATPLVKIVKRALPQVKSQTQN
ncbi:MAG: ECF transporter S component [Candidatus Bathyarchaeia archaeon]